MSLITAFLVAAWTPVAWNPTWRLVESRRVIAAYLQADDQGGMETGTYAESSSLLGQFRLGLTKQRAGDADGALDAYEVFVNAAQEYGAPPHTFAEVLVNMGILHAQRRHHMAARASFERALECRPLASAHVNLALLCLAEGSAAAKAEGLLGSMPVNALHAAKEHCWSAIELNDDERSVETAERLLGDMARRRS